MFEDKIKIFFAVIGIIAIVAIIINVSKPVVNAVKAINSKTNVETPVVP